MQQRFQWSRSTDSSGSNLQHSLQVHANTRTKTAPVFGPALKSRPSNAPLLCQAAKRVQSTHDSLLEPQKIWPAWSNNACRRLSQKQAGISIEGPSPLEAAQMLQQLARSCQHTNAPSRLALASDYPSQVAVEQLSAGWAAEGIWALAVLGGATLYMADTEGLLQVGCGQQWNPLTVTQATNCCWGLAHARHCTPALPDILKGSQLDTSSAQLKSQQVTTLLWSCAVLSHQPTTILASLAEHYTEHPEGLARLSPKALATCAWALAVLQQLHTPLFDMVWANLGTKPSTAFSKASLMQLHQVHVEASICKTEVGTALLAAAEKAWSTEAWQKSSKQDSSYVRDITDIAHGLGLSIALEDVSSGYAVDIALPVLRIAIEADGPSHRSRNTQQILGPTAMKERHVRAAGWRVLTITDNEWDLMQSKRQKQDYLQSRIDGFLTPPI